MIHPLKISLLRMDDNTISQIQSILLRTSNENETSEVI